jgi:hypothetical protein
VLGYEARAAMVHRDDLVASPRAPEEAVHAGACRMTMLDRNRHAHRRDTDTAALMAEIGRKARAALRPLAIASPRRKNAALLATWPTASGPSPR